MRELKFRIWDKQNKTWLENSSSLHCFSNWSICPFTGKLIDYVGAIDGDHGDKYAASPAPDYYMQDGKIVKDSRYVIQQYTGLKDKNGIEIYEGDIIQYNVGSSYDNISFVVKWSNDSLSWIFQSIRGEQLTNCWTPNGNRFNFIEIKGNIFENPELLKS